LAFKRERHEQSNYRSEGKEKEALSGERTGKISRTASVEGKRGGENGRDEKREKEGNLKNPPEEIKKKAASVKEPISSKGRGKNEGAGWGLTEKKRRAGRHSQKFSGGVREGPLLKEELSGLGKKHTCLNKTASYEKQEHQNSLERKIEEFG